MLRLPTFAFVAALIATCTLATRPTCALTIGGWTAARGGDSGILAGDDYAALRKDVAAYFPTVTLAESGTLTSTFLNSIDVLTISPVFGGESVTSTPLSPAEQTAMTTWVSGGGRALIIGENFNYDDASQSMIHPFGPLWESNNVGGELHGTITDHASFPVITNGPFGVVNTFQAGFDAWFSNVSPATPLGTWDGTGGAVCLAVMNFGSGKVVFFGSNTFLYGVDVFGLDPGNDALRRNTLTYLLGTPPRNQFDYNSNGVVDGADYVLYRQTFGQIGVNLLADGNLNHEIDAADYQLWRAHFGESAVIGSGAGSSAAQVPEPASLALVIIAFGLASLCHAKRCSLSLAV